MFGLRYRVGLVEHVGAGGVCFRQFQRRLLLGERGFELFELRPVRLDLGCGEGFVNLREQVALFHLVADFEQKLLQLTGNLRSHIDVILGLNFTGR